MSEQPSTQPAPVDTSSDIPAKEVDAYAKVKIGLAAAAVGSVFGILVGVAVGVIPDSNAAARIALPLAGTLVGVGVAFFFGKKSN